MTNVRLLVTTGDPDGVGLEVTAGALANFAPGPGVQVIFYRSPHSSRPRIGSHSVLSASALAEIPDAAGIWEITDSRSAALWVEEAATACFEQKAQALVTAPLSKTSIRAAGLSDIGHTEILARISKCRDLFMGFVGEKFSVVLAGGHEPLKRSLENFTPDRLAKALRAAERLRQILPPEASSRPIAVVGINPHAGENGLIGDDEAWVKTFCEGGIAGPLVPDAAFLPKQWERYSVYVVPYHDQGLIPFKLVHGFKGGVHVTLGLPFVRTSVDHGTAKDIFGKNQAESGSMKDALNLALKLTRREHA